MELRTEVWKKSLPKGEFAWHTMYAVFGESEVELYGPLRIFRWYSFPVARLSYRGREEEAKFGDIAFRFELEGESVPMVLGVPVHLTRRVERWIVEAGVRGHDDSKARKK